MQDSVIAPQWKEENSQDFIDREVQIDCQLLIKIDDLGGTP